MTDEAFLVLKELAEFVKKRIEEGIKNREIQKEKIDQVYFGWKVESFEYSLERGLIVPRATGDYITKKQVVFRHNIEESIKQSDEYKKALKFLSENFKTDSIEYKFESFLRKLIYHYLYESKIEEKLLEIFLKELREEPIKMSAVIELQGITLEPEIINIASGIKLRRPTIKDIEKEIPIYGYEFGIDIFLPNPSAIMEIESYCHNSTEIKKLVEKSIAILRLFKVGSVHYISYSIFSESLIGFISRVTSLGEPQVHEFYPLLNDGVEKLQKFWKEMSVSIPDDFIGFESSAQQGNLTFAYQRYSDALLSDGLLERRIANAIIGLEALYLNELEELKRYLILRVSKFLGIVGYNPYDIRNVLRDAYRIRSIFLHGNRLDYKYKKELEKEYGNLNKFLLQVLDYLRISIILMSFLRKEKDELIDLIDDAFIDKEKEDLLSTQLIGIKKRLCL